MSPLAQEEKAHQFCGMAAGGQRVGISEFARGKTWRNLLAEAGCVEVTDRAGTIGLLLTPDYAEDVSAYIAQLESELEQAYVRALFEMRSFAVISKSSMSSSRVSAPNPWAMVAPFPRVDLLDYRLLALY